MDVVKNKWRLCLYVSLLALIALPRSASAQSQEVKITVGEGRVIEGTLFVPSSHPAPGVLVLHTRGGREPADLAYGRELAQAGFVSLAVYYLNPQWGTRLHHPGYVRDLALVVDFLQGRPEVQGRPVGVVGFSLGSSRGVMLAARHQGVKAVVGYYGPYDLRNLPQARGTRDPASVDVAAEVGAPILLLHGASDNETPVSQAEALRDALVKAGKTVDLVVYPGAYHRFDRGPTEGMMRAASGAASGKGSKRGTGSTDVSPEGYVYRLDMKAQKDAWNRTLSWFRKYLTTAP